MQIPSIVRRPSCRHRSPRQARRRRAQSLKFLVRRPTGMPSWEYANKDEEARLAQRLPEPNTEEVIGSGGQVTRVLRCPGDRVGEVLRRALRLAHDKGLVASIPKIISLPEQNVREGFFERKEIEAVIANISKPLRDL